MEYFFCNHFSKTLVSTHQVDYIHIIGGNHNEVILESIDERGVKEAIKRTDGLHNSRMYRLFFYFLKFGNIVDSFIVSFVNFLLKVLFSFILKLIVNGFLNLIRESLNSSLWNGLTFRNSKESLCYSFTNDPFWVTEFMFSYDMSPFLCGVKILFWVKFNLKQSFLKGLVIILFVTLIEQKMEFSFSSRKLIDDESFNHVKVFSQQVSAYYSKLLSFCSNLMSSKSNMSPYIDQPQVHVGQRSSFPSGDG
jgi:hypothetical protein